MADHQKRKIGSGHSFRKRRAERLKEQAKQEGCLWKYLRTQEATVEQKNESRVETLTEETEPLCDVPSTSHATEEAVVDEKQDFKESESIVKTIVEEDFLPDSYSDPGKWPDRCSDTWRQLLVRHGPKQVVQHAFPKDSRGRRFSPRYYKRRLANGEELLREWLIYSISKDAVFCFCCKLFGKRAGTPSALQEAGSKDWKNMGSILSSHEKGTPHLENYQTWNELDLHLTKTTTTIDESNQQKIREEEQYWEEILERLIACVRLLGIQNLAFHGSSDKVYSDNNGNFLKFLEHLGLFDSTMKEYLCKVKDDATLVHCLGKDIQNELIQLLSGAIRQKILAHVNSAKYYSVILDCTQDVSHTEQMTIIIRYVEVISAGIRTSDQSKNSDPKVTIKEHFLGFVPLQETTGAFMTETLIGQLEQIGLPLENMRGQSYDNRSNMKGKESGVQKRVLALNPRAFLVPCSAHSLNLVVSDAAKTCLEAMSFFLLVQNIYNYFSASIQRWQILTSHLPSITVKPLSQTRWESRIDALKPLRYHLGSIREALVEIIDDKSQTTTSQAEAKGIAESISKFKFLVTLITWHNILSEINYTSKLLQSMEADLNVSARYLQRTKDYLVCWRCDEAFQQVLKDATEIAKELEIPPNLETEIRMRTKKLQFGEAQEEAPQNPEQKFKVDFYFAVLDMAIQSVEERFQQLQEYNSLFGFLYDVYGVNQKTTQDILKACKDLEKSLTYNVDKDIDAEDLCRELQAVARRLPEHMPPQGVLQFMVKERLLHIFPNVSQALRILLTLPVSVASGECSFSKLKLIKTYIRSTVLQEKLVGLATISIEHREASALDLKELVKKFASEKAHRVRF